MIHEIGVELRAQLIAIGAPHLVVDGPEPEDTVTWGRERIVLEYDEKATDTFGPVRSQHKNPKHRYTRSVAYKATIYAQSRVAGSTVFEHKRRANNILDAFLTSMDVVAAVRMNAWAPKTGSFITPPDLVGSQRDGGAVYELKFTFDRAVTVHTFTGGIQPEATFGPGGVGISNTNNVTGPDGAAPVIACGT